jgi:hypothetical protein
MNDTNLWRRNELNGARIGSEPVHCSRERESSSVITLMEDDGGYLDSGVRLHITKKCFGRKFKGG